MAISLSTLRDYWKKVSDWVDGLYEPKVRLGSSAIAYDSADDMFKMKSVQKKWRDSFPGTSLDTNKWTVVQQGSGQTITVTGGTLQVALGTTAGAETIIESKEVFTIPARAMFGMYVSQKIANNEVVVELVSVNPNTLQADGKSAAAWSINGNDNTSTTNAVYEVQTDGLARLRSGSVSVLPVTSYSVFEIEAFADETWFHQRSMDSSSGRSYSYVRHQQIPDPTALYKVRLRFKNGSTAPASNTTAYIRFVIVMDYAELTAEITASRGIISSGQAMGVQVVNSPWVYVYMSSAYGLFYNETTTNLGASATFTGGARDHGGSTLTNARARCSIAHQAGNTPGHLYFEQSTDNSTWRVTHIIPIPSDGLYRTFEFPVIMRYTRFKFVNGSTAQTLMHLQSAYFKADGPFDLDKTLTFLHSTTPLGASATFTGTTLDLGGNHSFNRHRATVFADQVGTLQFQESRDGTTWRTIKTVSVTANTTVSDEVLITQRYQRVVFVNGATAQTAFELSSALVRQ